MNFFKKNYTEYILKEAFMAGYKAGKNKLTESLHTLMYGAFITDSEYDVMNLLVNKTKDYRILYDKNLDMYMIGDASWCTHLHMFNEAISQGYYHRTGKDSAIDWFCGDGDYFDGYNYWNTGSYGEVETNDPDEPLKEFGQYLYWIYFSPTQTLEDQEPDGYDNCIKTAIGNVITGWSPFEEVPLYNLFVNRGYI